MRASRSVPKWPSRMLPRPAPAPQSAAAHPMPAVNAAPKPVADQGAAAMPAQPVARNEDVMIRATPPKPSLFAEPPRPAPAETSMPKVFIPPQPERPANRAPRMPTFEELPVPGQNEFRARRGELPEADHPEKRRLTLLQRLAAVGLGRREDEPDSEQKPEGRTPEPAKRQIASTAPEHRSAEASGVGTPTGVRAAAAAQPAANGRARAATRSPTLPNEGGRRASTSTAGRRRCIIQATTTNSTSPRSCAGRQPEERASPARRSFQLAGQVTDFKHFRSDTGSGRTRCARALDGTLNGVAATWPNAAEN